MSDRETITYRIRELDPDMITPPQKHEKRCTEDSKCNYAKIFPSIDVIKKSIGFLK